MNNLYNTPTVGIVTDTNDPMQMGRVRVICPAWGDSPKTDTHEGEWAQYVTPFGGTVTSMTRGPGIQQSKGGVTYGMWAIPKIGAQVLVICANGDPSQRFYIGCIYDMHSVNSIPHGRYMYDDHPALDSVGQVAKPAGPFTNAEGFLEPLNTNQKAAFKNYGEANYEWQTRAADYTASAVDIENINDSFSRAPDDKAVEHEGRIYTQGYQSSRIDPNSTASATHANYDSQVYCLVSPGFHAISMDDRQENCRMRMRTVGGHQIILDDTNERIYISTARGANWIELDQNGNIDIFSNNKISVRSTQDINFTSDKSIKLFAKENIHMRAGKQIRMFSTEQMHIKTSDKLLIKCKNLDMDVIEDINIKSGSNYKLTTTTRHIKSTDSYETYTNALNIGSKTLKTTITDVCDIKAGTLHLSTTTGDIDISSAASLQVRSITNALLTSANIEMMGLTKAVFTGGGATMRLMGVLTYPATPQAMTATPQTPQDADPAEEANPQMTLTAFMSNRVPDHEPWGRAMTKEDVDQETQELGDFSQEPELDYTDSKVGKFERGLSIIRGMFWRR